MERLTNDQLEAIRKRAEKATEGPWKVYDEYCDTVEREEDGECIARIASRDKRNDDMEFITHARTDIPKLLAEIDRLHGILHDAREEIRRGKNGRAIDILEDWGDNE